MKKTITVIVALSVALTTLCACSKTSEHKSEYIELCDYKNLTINLDEYKVTDEEVNTAIQMRMIEHNVLEPINEAVEDGDFVQLDVSINQGTYKSFSYFVGDEEIVNGFDENLLGHKTDENISLNIGNDSYDIKIVSVKRTPLEITDEIAVEYFDVSNVREVINDTKKKIAENRFCEAAINIILTNSNIIKFPDYCYDYVEKIVEKHKTQADNSGKSSKDYFNEVFEMSEEEYREAVLSGYGDYLVLKEIASIEGYIPSDEEMNNLIEYTAKLDGISYEDVKETYGEEYFEYMLYESFVKEVIINLYSEQINKSI